MWWSVSVCFFTYGNGSFINLLARCKRILQLQWTTAHALTPHVSTLDNVEEKIFYDRRLLASHVWARWHFMRCIPWMHENGEWPHRCTQRPIKPNCTENEIKIKEIMKNSNGKSTRWIIIIIGAAECATDAIIESEMRRRLFKWDIQNEFAQKRTRIQCAAMQIAGCYLICLDKF